MRSNVLVFLFFALICLVNIGSHGPAKKKNPAPVPAANTMKMAEVAPGPVHPKDEPTVGKSPAPAHP
jgi:hypothetical protein